MALIIEDGSLVANSNSWVTRADYIAHAASLGVTVADADAADIELIKAAQFIGSHEANLKGYLVDRDQALSFPRHEVYIDGFYWESTEIPRQVIALQMAVALEINEGLDPYNPPVNSARATKLEKVDGAVEVEYFGKDGDAVTMRRGATTAMLASLLNRSGLYSMPLVRV